MSNPAESARRERLVAAAVADGRILAERQSFWLDQMARDPNAEQMLAILARGLPATGGRAAGSVAAPPTSRASGGRFGHPTATAVSARAREPRDYRAAAAKSPEPTLFGGLGDLPPFTASGIDPQALLQVPWQARHTLASAGTPREAYAILNEFTGLSPAEAETLAVTAYGGHPGNGEYVQRVEQWVADGMDPGTTYDRVFGENEGYGPA